MADGRHAEACCQACGFAAEVAAGRAPQHTRGVPIDLDGRSDVPQGVTLQVRIKGVVLQRVPMASPTFSIGRGPNNNLQLPNVAMSKRQFELRVMDGQLLVLDLKSACGTFVNGKRITRPTALHHGDRVWASDATFEIEVAPCSLQSVDVQSEPPSASSSPSPVEVRPDPLWEGMGESGGVLSS